MNLYLKHGENISEDFLAHYGVLGMKWGKRKGSGGAVRRYAKAYGRAQVGNLRNPIKSLKGEARSAVKNPLHGALALTTGIQTKKFLDVKNAEVSRLRSESKKYKQAKKTNKEQWRKDFGVSVDKVAKKQQTLKKKGNYTKEVDDALGKEASKMFAKDAVRKQKANKKAKAAYKKSKSFKNVINHGQMLAHSFLYDVSKTEGSVTQDQNNTLAHYGVKGMRRGVRRVQQTRRVSVDDLDRLRRETQLSIDKPKKVDAKLTKYPVKEVKKKVDAKLTKYPVKEVKKKVAKKKVAKKKTSKKKATSQPKGGIIYMSDIDSNIEDFLAHYGVLGMKWGKRKAANAVVKAKRASDKKAIDKMTAKSKKEYALNANMLETAGVFSKSQARTSLKYANKVADRQAKNLSRSSKKVRKFERNDQRAKQAALVSKKQDEVLNKAVKKANVLQKKLMKSNNLEERVKLHSEIKTIISDANEQVQQMGKNLSKKQKKYNYNKSRLGEAGIKHGENLSDNFLVHYGVLGMKWGKRKGTSSSVSKTGSKRSKKENVKNMSDAELRQRINRLNMEKQYKQLTTKDKSQARQFVNSVLKESAKNTASSYVSKAMKTGIDSTVNRIKRRPRQMKLPI